MGYVKDIELQGSDPRNATCRSKLQNQRSRLNQEINKELRLRAGAENLFKATSNLKLRDTVALELSFVNSNLQLLKEELAALNSSVEIYQNDRQGNFIPMIPLGLKETKQINFMDPFSDFILEHYSEDPSFYSDAIVYITETRQAARTPTRDTQGISLLFRYHNLLYYVERRFFPPDRNLGVYFEWYDSLTGTPSCQRTIALEKACTLFNLGAIYTQIGAKHDRSSEQELDSAIESFLKAAGVFRHIFDTFSNAPSIDLKPEVLDLLVSLLLAQARECHFEKLRLLAKIFDNSKQIQLYRDLAGESAQLVTEYMNIHKNVQSNDTYSSLPECWVGLIPVKAEFYKALAHHYAAKSVGIGEICSTIDKKNHNKPLPDGYGSFFLKWAHIKESLASHEETQRLQRMCRFLKNKTIIDQVLKEAFFQTREEYEQLIKEGTPSDYAEDLDLVEVIVEPSSKLKLTSIGPDFTSHKVDDPFKRLGPIAIFSARRHWTAPRCIQLQQRSAGCDCRAKSTETNICVKYLSSEINTEVTEIFESYGFHIRGDAPVIISQVDINSLADLGGMKESDILVEVSGVDVKWHTSHQIARLMQMSGPSIELKIITPMDENYLKPLLQKYSKSIDSIPRDPSESSNLTIATSKLKSPGSSRLGRFSTLSSNSWNPFRRSEIIGKNI